MKMLKRIMTKAAAGLGAILFGGMAATPLLQGAPTQCSLPPGPAEFTVVSTPESFTPVAFHNLPPGYAITNGPYQGWCVQYETFIDAGPVYHASLYDTGSPLPGHLQGVPWDKVNYILNHKRGSYWDVQYVIWYVMGQALNPPATTDAVEMLWAANEFGSGFVPSNGQLVGLLLEPREGVQRLLIETICDTRCRDTVAPTAAISSPFMANQCVTSQTIRLDATVTDDVGVTEVSFFDGPNLVAVDSAAPFFFDWSVTEADNAPHQWRVQAFDYAGNNAFSTTLNVTVAIDVVPPTAAIASPLPDSRYTASQIVPIIASVSDNFGVTRVEFYQNGSLKLTQSSAPFAYPWSIVGAENGQHVWTVRAYDGAGNSATSESVRLLVDLDLQLPVVTILSPAHGGLLTNQIVILTGTASDNVGVARVEYQLDNGPFLLASGTGQWAAQAQVDPGNHTVRAKSVDTSGNESISATRTFSYFNTSPLQVSTTGRGAVLPNLNGLNLEIDRTYSMTALPELGHAFSNWSGGLSASSRQLTFVMRPNLLLRATFSSDVFSPVNGTYQGLFYDTNGIAHASSGSATITTTDRGTFSAKLFVAGVKVTFTGRLDNESKFHGVIRRRGRSPLTVDLHLYRLDGADYIQGHVSDGGFHAELFTERVGNHPAGNPSPFEGAYTFALPDAGRLVGDGFGAVKVGVNGRLILRGFLGDGTRIRQRAFVSAQGHWALYSPLYRRAGSLLGWVSFGPAPANQLTGTLAWSTPSAAARDLTVLGGRYLGARRPRTPILSFSSGTLTLAGGALPASLANPLQLSNNQVTDLSGNSLTLKCAVKTGLFNGKLIDPLTGKTLLFKGALVPSVDTGFGLFTGAGSAGNVRLEASP